MQNLIIFIISYLVAFIILVIGLLTLPERPVTVIIGTEVKGMSDSEYTSMVVRSPGFILSMIGVGIMGITALINWYSIEGVKRVRIRPGHTVIPSSQHISSV